MKLIIALNFPIKYAIISYLCSDAISSSQMNTFLSSKATFPSKVKLQSFLIEHTTIL